MKKFTSLKLLALALVTSLVYAQDPLIPVSIITSFTPEFGTDPVNTINGTGMVSFPSLTANHQPSDPANSFVGIGTGGAFDFDLGGTHTINGFSFWNQNAGGPGADGITGIRTLSVQSSTNGVDYFPIPDSPAIFQQVFTNLSPPEMFSFPPVDAAFVRFIVDTNYGDVNTGFAEIAFSELVLGTTDEELGAAVLLAPNPANDIVILENNSNVALQQALIYNLSGQLILKLDLLPIAGQQHIDIGSLASGLYLVKITAERGQLVKRLIKQ